jgi:hypothetical protein
MLGEFDEIMNTARCPLFHYRKETVNLERERSKLSSFFDVKEVEP